ncbi:MAG: lipoprotein insertase outer membrane protein LolB [Gammaproteobacteria bacterium]
MPRRLIRALLLAACVAAAAGCASRPTLTLPPLDDWSTRRDVLASVDTWRAGGRIGIVAGGEAESGSLDWREEAGDVEVAIRGPLGAGGLRLEGGADRLVLTESNGNRTVLVQPERELRQRYGWSVPVASLSWWLRGLPDPARPSDTRIGAEGRLTLLEQAGWTIEYPEYRAAAGVLLPYRIRARSADIRLTIVVREWGFGRAAVR